MPEVPNFQAHVAAKQGGPEKPLDTSELLVLLKAAQDEAARYKAKFAAMEARISELQTQNAAS